ncbi:MAG: hypothetical protein LBS34_00460 [Rickettsiales bacterium]|nr:hypothetical protein [Rickettsiales bacterium]
MRKLIIIATFVIIFLVDFIFFDYDISDIKHFKEDVSIIIEKIDKGLDFDLPFYFTTNGFYIKNCKQYFTYRPTAANAFEKEVLRELDKKCNFRKIISNARISSNSFIDNVVLTDFDKWEGDLFLRYTCNAGESNYVNKYKNAKELIDVGVVSVDIIDKHHIIVQNKTTNRKLFIREIFRANFDKEKSKDVLVEIAIADPTDNYIECTKYAVFSRKNDKNLLNDREYRN